MSRPGDPPLVVLPVPGGDPAASRGIAPVVGAADWTDPLSIPRGFGSHESDRRIEPEYIQANLFTLSQIGGVYDLLALAVEKDHLAILTAWRLDSGAPRAIDYIRARATRHGENNR